MSADSNPLAGWANVSRLGSFSPTVADHIGTGPEVPWLLQVQGEPEPDRDSWSCGCTVSRNSSLQSRLGNTPQWMGPRFTTFEVQNPDVGLGGPAT